MIKKLLMNCVQLLQMLTTTSCQLTVRETKTLYRTLTLLKFWLKILDDFPIETRRRDIECSLSERNDMLNEIDDTIRMMDGVIIN